MATPARRRPTQRELARRAGVCVRTLQSYARAGVNIASLRAIRKHQAGLRHAGILPMGVGRCPDLAAARLALIRARADKCELEAAALRESLIDISGVRRDLLAIRETVGAALLAMVDDLPPMLANREPPEMAEAIRAHTDGLLRRLSDPGAYAGIGNVA
jgi:transcriptional regulator with XRE-family HTH domain